MSWLAFAIGLILAVIGIGGAIALASSSAQPWDPELTDNLIFAKSLPFILGFGILSGLARAASDRWVTERRPDGAIRRFSPGTALNHWINALGFLIAITTGSVQYLIGVADATLPFPLFWVYRLHFIGASLMVYSAALFVTHRLITGDTRLLPGRGEWIRHFRGLAHELPRPLGNVVAGVLGLDLRREPPPVGQFTYYEKAFSFPVWVLLLGLIIVTGLLKAMRYVAPIPGEVLWWASALHVAAMILLAAKFLDHLRYVLAPSRWPLLRSMVQTWVSQEYVRLRHPLWFESVQREERGPAPGGVGSAPEPARGGPHVAGGSGP
ncbi:MAG: cytochrome b/b6 domain-containing protein [Chloroflexi bacterium]|nr:cytochrome b/b6 domain-containing protein [Chloroflexota bacterium]